MWEVRGAGNVHMWATKANPEIDLNTLCKFHRMDGMGRRGIIGRQSNINSNCDGITSFIGHFSPPPHNPFLYEYARDARAYVCASQFAYVRSHGQACTL